MAKLFFLNGYTVSPESISPNGIVVFKDAAFAQINQTKSNVRLMVIHMTRLLERAMLLIVIFY